MTDSHNMIEIFKTIKIRAFKEKVSEIWVASAYAHIMFILKNTVINNSENSAIYLLKNID